MVTLVREKLLAKNTYTHAEWSITLTLKKDDQDIHYMYVTGTHPVWSNESFMYEGAREAWSNYIQACDYFAERAVE